MAEYDFKQVQVFLIEKEANTRRLLRGILTRMGMEKVFEFPSAAEALNALATTMPDLVIADCDPADGDGFRFIHQLRHTSHATNPFVAAIATTWQPTHQVMVRFTGSGADDLMVKPFSAKQVQDRVHFLVEHRKRFVVTSDYIGPDRRRAPREEGQAIPLIEVPNTLRLKALGLLDRSTISEQIGRALIAINEQKVVRHGFQAAFLMDFALPGLDLSPPDRRAVDHVLRVIHVVEDLLRRMPAGDAKLQAEMYTRVLLDGLAGFKLDMTKPLGDALTLKRAAMGLAALTARRSDLPVLEQEVAAAVSAYRNRLDQMAQAKAQASPTSQSPNGAAATPPPTDAEDEADKAFDGGKSPNGG